MSAIRHTPNTHTRRIAIVGAGPAGLSAAHHLREFGYDDVRVFEAESRVGGKCLSSIHRGVQFDLGARYAHYGYVDVRQLAEYHGVEWSQAPSLVLASLDEGRIGKLGLPLRRDLATVEAAGRLARLLLEHRHLWHPGFLRFSPSLAVPATEWLSAQGLDALADTLLPAFTGYGYGYPDDLPAGYLLKMIFHIVARSPLDNARWAAQILQLADPGALSRLFDPLVPKDGFEGLFAAVAARLDVQTGTPVVAVVPEEDAVIVSTPAGEESFDAVILAVAPSVIQRVVAHEGVRSVFGLAMENSLHSLLVECDGFRPHEAWFVSDNARYVARRGRPVQVADPHPGSGLVTVLAHGGEGINEAMVERHVREDLGRWGLAVGRVVEHHRLPGAAYAPPAHFVEFHDRLESLQGLSGLYFTGEVMNAGSVEGAVAYSRSLVTRFF